MIPLVVFELRRRLRSGRLTFALVLVATGAAALGLGLETGHLTRDDSGSLYSLLLILPLTLIFRFDLAHDVEKGTADLLAPNLVGVHRFVAARLLAGLVALVQFAVPAALLTALVPGLDLRFALWYGALWCLVALLLAPAVMMAELWLRTRLPGLAVTLLALILLFGAVSAVGYLPVSAALGVQSLVPGHPGSLVRLASRALVIGPGGLILVGLVASRHWSPDR